MNYKARNKYRLLDDHEATGTEAIYTFTKTLTTDDYSAIEIYITGLTSATLALEMVLNGSESTNNYSYGLYCTASAIATLAKTGADAMTLLSATSLSSTDPFTGKIIITLEDQDAAYNVSAYSVFQAANNNRSESMFHTNNQNLTSITSITIQTSTSTWTSGTRILIYGVQR